MKQNCNNVHDNTSSSVTAEDNVIVVHTDTMLHTAGIPKEQQKPKRKKQKKRQSQEKKKDQKIFSALKI